MGRETGDGNKAARPESGNETVENKRDIVSNVPWLHLLFCYLLISRGQFRRQEDELKGTICSSS